MDCRRSRTVFHADSVFPVFAYRLWKKNLLFSWKMSDRRSLSPLFAAVCDGVLKTGFGEGCVLVPVPPRAGKIRRRGMGPDRRTVPLSAVFLRVQSSLSSAPAQYSAAEET